MSGKTALVCGASKGIGAATAKEFAELGARVVLLARNGEALQEVKSNLPTPKGGKEHLMVASDLLDRQGLEQKINELLGLTGPISILVCNAGGPPAGPLLEASEEEVLKAFQIHVLSNNLLVRLLRPGMLEQGYGRVVNVISTSVKMPIPNLGASNTVRGAVANWAKTLANELGPDGITVNNVLPGYTETGRLDALLDGASKRTGQTLDQVRESWRAKVPLRRFAKPQETAEAIAFLGSPAAAYISGVNLPVDGGRTGCL